MGKNTLMTAAEVVKELNVKKETLYKMAREKTVPTYRVGAGKRGVRFNLPELIHAMRQPAQPSEPTTKVHG